jgi:pimeloyl-ACP methyl ester carboxylesterase
VTWGGLRSIERAPEHVVFLVPGLLGFESFSTFGYFADRVTAALRAGLEQAWERPVTVVPVPIPPTASLAERQRRLVKTIAERTDALVRHGRLGSTPPTVHLVGHSTGGVDATLLTCSRPIGAGTWGQLDPRAPELLSRIRSVVSIGSPHQGACITRDPVARLVGERRLGGMVDLAILLGKFAWSTALDVDASSFASSSSRELGKVLRFLLAIFDRWSLVDDLLPSRGYEPTTLRSDVARRSVVLVAGHSAVTSAVGARSPEPGGGDRFFDDLYRRSSGWVTGCSEEGAQVEASVQRLRGLLAGPQGRSVIIKNPRAALPPLLDAGHNDGVVNTARQLVDPHSGDELLAVVVADHFDVLGYYDRFVWRVDEQGRKRIAPIIAGILHSGSSFGDDQFFEVYRRVASAIAAAGRN